jgi:hypothetical protein
MCKPVYNIINDSGLCPIAGPSILVAYRNRGGKKEARRGTFDVHTSGTLKQTLTANSKNCTLTLASSAFLILARR